jgi:hypothetical protein
MAIAATAARCTSPFIDLSPLTVRVVPVRNGASPGFI